MKKYIYIFLALFLASCTSDPIEDPDGGKGKGKGEYISFVVKSNDPTPVSRATPTRGTPSDPADYNENLVDIGSDGTIDLHVFIFDQAGSTCLFYPEPERFEIEPGANSGENVIKIKLKAESGDQFETIPAATLMSQNTRIYVVANSRISHADFADGTTKHLTNATYSTLANIKKKIYNTDTFNQLTDGEIVKQDRFIMDLQSDVYITNDNLGLFSLERAASKIEVGVYNVSVPGHTHSAVGVKLVNYADATYVGDTGSPYESTLKSMGDYISIPVGEVLAEGTVPQRAAYAEPLYSYERDWSSDRINGACLILKVTMSSGAQSEHFYKVPLSFFSPDETGAAALLHKLKRNYLYRYFLTITEAGGATEETATELSGNIDIMPWGKETENSISVRILKFDWLFVQDQTLVIYPEFENGRLVTDYTLTIPYLSSSDINYAQTVAGVDDFTASYNRFINDAGKDYNEVVPIGSANAQYPEVTLNNRDAQDNRYIKVKSAYPNNFVQKDIWMKVENSAHLFATISIIHYPALYVSTTLSTQATAPPGTYGTVTNPSNVNLYTITTLALTGGETFLWDPGVNNAASRTYSIGSAFDSNREYIRTGGQDAKNAWVVSPKFTVQSGYGKVSRTFPTINRAETVTRCQGYYERTATGDILDGWRMPTLAELYLIDKVQADESSAVNGALNAGFGAQRVWSAGYYDLNGVEMRTSYVLWYAAEGAVYDMENRNTIAAVQPLRHVPLCVRDFYQ